MRGTYTSQKISYKPREYTQQTVKCNMLCSAVFGCVGGVVFFINGYVQRAIFLIVGLMLVGLWLGI